MSRSGGSLCVSQRNATHSWFADERQGRLSPDPSRLQPDQGAQFLVRCLIMAKKDSKLAASEREKAVAKYAEAALEMLRSAVGQGYRDVASLESQPLCEREDFKVLLTQLKAKAKS